jgi:GDP-L-fucose synthase
MKVFVAGHRGMVGSAVVEALRSRGYEELVTRSSRELDLRDGGAVSRLFRTERPTHVVLAAAKVGGILANDTYRAEFLYDNLAIELNVIHQAHKWGVEKLLFLGSSCIYPKHTEQPIKEEQLLTGPLEPTNEPYAIAKIAGIKLCEAYRDQYGVSFISAMPTNLYGPGDDYDLVNAHVVPALIRRMHEAKLEKRDVVDVWGDGSPLREFMHVRDLARALVFLLEEYDGRQFINVGSGQEISIRGLAEMIKDIVGYPGQLRFDTSKPNGTPRKLLDSRRLTALGFQPEIPLAAGLQSTYDDFVERYPAYCG